MTPPSAAEIDDRVLTLPAPSTQAIRRVRRLVSFHPGGLAARVRREVRPRPG